MTLGGVAKLANSYVRYGPIIFSDVGRCVKVSNAHSRCDSGVKRCCKDNKVSRSLRSYSGVWLGRLCKVANSHSRCDFIMLSGVGRLCKDSKLSLSL